ncbi:MAG: hypothetical protein ACXAC2_19045, partial [Candidatus Kariarchaeaceae archaeon]
GYIIADGNALTFNAGKGGYQFLKSKKLFDRETIATVDLTSFHDMEFNPHAHFMYLGWSSTLPTTTSNYDWNLEDSENAIFIKNTSLENYYQLSVIRDSQHVRTLLFELNTDKVISLSLYWGIEEITIMADGEIIGILADVTDDAPEIKMYYYLGVSSRGGPDDNNNMVIHKLTLDGQISTSNMPMFVDAPKGYFFVENDDLTATQSISWTVDDDDPSSYSIFQNGVLIQSGIWESNRPIITSINDREAPDSDGEYMGRTVGIYEFIIQLNDEANNFLSQRIYVKVVPFDYYSNPIFAEDFDGSDLDLNIWNTYEKEDSIFDLQNSVLTLEGGDQNDLSGTAVAELDFQIQMNTSVHISANLVKPPWFGGVGFGISDVDFTSSAFSNAGTVFAPDIHQLAKNSLYLFNNQDGSHFQIYLESTPQGTSISRISIYNFYIDEDEEFEEFLIVRNIDGSEFYVNGKLIHSFGSGNTPISGELLFSAFATTWGFESQTQIDGIEIHQDITKDFLLSGNGGNWVSKFSSEIMPNEALAFTFTDNPNEILPKDISIPYTPPGSTTDTSTSTTSTSTTSTSTTSYANTSANVADDPEILENISTELDIDKRIFLIIGLIVGGLGMWRFQSKIRRNTNFYE